MKNHKRLLKMILSALFISLAYLFPFLTGQIPSIGAMLCPMHIPVILCGFICGWQYGLIVGLISPLLRSFTLGMPPFFPTALCMAVELSVYGAVSGIMHRMFKEKKFFIYVSLIVSMLLGRVAWGLAMYFFLGIGGTGFTIGMFVAGAFTNAIPGIILQLIVIPVIVKVAPDINKERLIYEQ